MAALGLMAAPAAAQPQGGPVVTGGLVNVTVANVNVEDVVDIGDVTVQLPVAAAANVCGVDVDLLVAQIEASDDNTTECDAQARSGARN